MPSTTNPEESRNELPTNPPEAQSGVCISDQIRVLTLQAEIAREEREKAKWAYELKKLDVEQDRSQLPRVSTESSASVNKSDAINCSPIHPEAKRKRLEEQQAGTVTTGREELQKRSNGRRGTRK